MTMEQRNLHIKYMKEVLVPEIVSKFKNENVKDVKIDCSTGLDGFMSTLYNITLKTTLNELNSSSKERMIIVKFMRGDEQFRESSKSYVQFANEICVYDKILPAYNDLLKRAKITDVSVEDWVAHCYAAKFGYIHDLSSHPQDRECVLALENLKPQGYRMGPRPYLDRDHLFLMAKTLGQYHSMSYVLRSYNSKQFEELRKKLVPLPFVDTAATNDAKPNLYRLIYRVAFDRFFEYFDRISKQNAFDKNSLEDAKLIENIQKLRKYFEEPTILLEQLRTRVDNIVEDRHWGAILHGDFNRNNVMFRYQDNTNQNEENTNNGKLVDIKLIDFQEIRYGTPAIDLSFYMFFNTSESLRAEVWMDILKTYHNEMYNMLEKTLRGLKNEADEADIQKTLELYSFENFNAHFSRYAFYGVMICLHFLPWVLCSDKECSELSDIFESDMHSEDFYKGSMTAGGDDANKSIFEVVRFASKMGYMCYL